MIGAKLLAAESNTRRGAAGSQAKQPAGCIYGMTDNAGDVPRPPQRMGTIILTMPPERIALFKAIVESYDNLATLRTEDPRQHHLKLYFAPEMSAEVEALLDSLQADFAIRRLAAG
jgi:uncharacterized protein DUF4911